MVKGPLGDQLFLKLEQFIQQFQPSQSNTPPLEEETPPIKDNKDKENKEVKEDQLDLFLIHREEILALFHSYFESFEFKKLEKSIPGESKVLEEIKEAIHKFNSLGKAWVEGLRTQQKRVALEIIKVQSGKNITRSYKPQTPTGPGYFDKVK